MPVSKKRKKDGKPVHRSQPAPPPAEQSPAGEQAPAAEAHPAHPQARMVGKPSNPFVTQQQGRRGAQRGR